MGPPDFLVVGVLGHLHFQLPSRAAMIRRMKEPCVCVCARLFNWLFSCNVCPTGFAWADHAMATFCSIRRAGLHSLCAHARLSWPSPGINPSWFIAQLGRSALVEESWLLGASTGCAFSLLRARWRSMENLVDMCGRTWRSASGHHSPHLEFRCASTVA